MSTYSLKLIKFQAFKINNSEIKKRKILSHFLVNNNEIFNLENNDFVRNCKGWIRAVYINHMFNEW